MARNLLVDGRCHCEDIAARETTLVIMTNRMTSAIPIAVRCLRGPLLAAACRHAGAGAERRTIVRSDRSRMWTTVRQDARGEASTAAIPRSVLSRVRLACRISASIWFRRRVVHRVRIGG
jgi:hypothetical protein